MIREDLGFLERRAREEAELAETACNPVAASAHRLLAIQYEDDLRARRDAPAERAVEAA